MTECVVDWRNVAISIAAEIARIPDADRVRWRLESAAETGSSWLRPDYRAAADLVAEEIAARDKPLLSPMLCPDCARARRGGSPQRHLELVR